MRRPSAPTCSSSRARVSRREDVDESLKALYETGLFADVQINQRGGSLVVVVVENPMINQVAFEGNKKYKDEQLASLVQSEPRGVFTRAKVQNDVAAASSSFTGSPAAIRRPSRRRRSSCRTAT